MITEQLKKPDSMDFPLREIPIDPPRFRLAGLYPQAQEGFWMQRIRVLGGALTANQWRGLADIARRYTPDTPLHLTTRQDVEFHDLRAEQIPSLQQALAAEGFTGLGACGDTVRNITVCPCSGVVRDSIDLHPLASALQHRLQAWDGVFSLPRKFKISLSCCPDAKAQPWINDLGFTVRRHDRGWSFLVTVGGSLGARPGAAIVWRERLDPKDAPACALAALSIFHQHGNRRQRHRARLRHVREEMGDVKFLELLDRRFQDVQTQQNTVFEDYPHTPQGCDHPTVLTFPNGDVTADEAETIAALIDQNHAVRIGNHHRILVFSPSEEAAGSVRHSAIWKTHAVPQVSVVACPGRRWCKHGLTDTDRMADEIRQSLKDTLPANCTVAVSGCPNGCAQSAVADIGLVGQLTGPSGQTRQAYTVWIGGGGGQTPRLAQPVKTKLPEVQVIDFLRNL